MQSLYHIGDYYTGNIRMIDLRMIDLRMKEKENLSTKFNGDNFFNLTQPVERYR